jgi:uncharacterized RDD family membrane protein YckC
MSEPVPAFGAPCPNHPDVAMGLQPCARCGVSYCGDCLVPIGGQLACANCKDEVVRDLRSGSAELDLAGPGKRLVGAFVDGLLVGVPLIVVMLMMFGVGKGSSLGVSAGVGLVAALITLLYDALMTASGGQTVGKKVAGIKVVTVEGADVGTGQAFVRAGSRTVMNLTRVLGLVDALFVFSDKRRTLHDRIARTVVVNWR